MTCIPVPKRLLLVALVVYLINPTMDQQKMPMAVVMAFVLVQVLSTVMDNGLVNDSSRVDGFASVPEGPIMTQNMPPMGSGPMGTGPGPEPGFDMMQKEMPPMDMEDVMDEGLEVPDVEDVDMEMTEVVPEPIVPASMQEQYISPEQDSQPVPVHVTAGTEEQLQKQQNWQKIASDYGLVQNRVQANTDLLTNPFAESEQEVDLITGFHSRDVNGILQDDVGPVVPITRTGPVMSTHGLPIIPDLETGMHNGVQSELKSKYYDASSNDTSSTDSNSSAMTSESSGSSSQGIPHGPKYHPTDVRSRHTGRIRADEHPIKINHVEGKQLLRQNLVNPGFPDGHSTSKSNPGYFLLNNNEYSKDGVPMDKIRQVILNSKYHDIYHQHAHVPPKGREPLLGKGRRALPHDKTFEFHGEPHL